MAAMLGNSAVVVVVAVVVRTRPLATPLAMITMRKSTRGFPFLSHDKYGAPLGSPSGCWSSVIKLTKPVPADRNSPDIRNDRTMPTGFFGHAVVNHKRT